MKAIENQVGGSHYKSMKIQPVELFAKTHCTAFQANIWKYVLRYKQKNGKQDLEKAIHYAQLAIELECNGSLSNDAIKEADTFCKVNELQPNILAIVMAAANDAYSYVIYRCKDLIQKEYPS
jgi:hypothetical protein